MDPEAREEKDCILAIWSPTICQFTVPGDPSPQSRYAIGKGGNKYDPSKAKKLQFRSAAQNSLSLIESDKAMFGRDVVLSMSVVFRMRRPDSHFVGRNRASATLKSTAPSAVLVNRSDVDNLLKFVMDALNTVLYEDDKQVAAVHAFRLYDDSGTCEGYTTVRIEPVGDVFPSWDCIEF